MRGRCEDDSVSSEAAKPGRKPVAQEALDAYGLDAVCEAIAGGGTLTAVAKDAGVSLTRLLAWIDADSERSVRVREARASSAKLWDESAEREIRGATDEFELRKARELAQHFRWRATKIAPKEYGERQAVEHSGKVGLESLVAGAGADPE